MHNLDTPSLAAICIALQAISRRGLPVALVGAGPPDLHVRLLSAKPYADRLFQYPELAAQGTALVFGPVADPVGVLGLAVVSGESMENARALTTEDPTVTSGVSRCEFDLVIAFVLTVPVNRLLITRRRGYAVLHELHAY